MDSAKETGLRSQGTNQQFGMMKYDAIPGGTSIAGTTVPIRKGVEFYDWNNNNHVMQKSTRSMNSTTIDNAELQNENTRQVADQKIEASNTYQSDMNSALSTQAAQSIGAINTGTAISSKSSREGANIQISGINRAAASEKQSNQLNFEGRIDAAGINQSSAMEAARLRMMSTVVTGFFRDMDRRIEEMKPKY